LILERLKPYKLAGALALFAVLWAVSVPAEPKYRLCGFYWLTGHPCPLCGLTRGVFALAKGHWREALAFNALTPLALTMLFALFWDSPIRARLWTLGILAFALYGVVRFLA
jgi:hypothetical protein